MKRILLAVGETSPPLYTTFHKGVINMGGKRLYRTEYEYKMLCGVCGGIAEYFDIDPTLVRVIWVIAAFMGSLGFWAYLICAIIMPKKSDIYPGY